MAGHSCPGAGPRLLIFLCSLFILFLFSLSLFMLSLLSPLIINVFCFFEEEESDHKGVSQLAQLQKLLTLSNKGNIRIKKACFGLVEEVYCLLFSSTLLFIVSFILFFLSNLIVGIWDKHARTRQVSPLHP